MSSDVYEMIAMMGGDIPSVIDTSAFVSNNSSLTLKERPCTIDELCTILPQLIHWRLLVSYAPFFAGERFEPTASEASPLHVTLSASNSGRMLSIVPDSLMTQHAAREARRLAENIHAHIKYYYKHIDFANLHDKYSTEKASYTKRTTLARFRTILMFPTLRAVLKVAKKLDIPTRQLETALQQYAAFVNSLRQETSQETAYHNLSVEVSAAKKEWQDLAEMVYKDNSDVYRHRILAKEDRHNKWRETLMFERAISRCRSRYFCALKLERQILSCGCPANGTVWNSRPVYHRIRGEDSCECFDGSKRARIIPAIIDGIKSVISATSIFKLFSRHFFDSCECCPRFWKVSYRLSAREQALEDGSFGFVNNILRSGRGLRRRSGCANLRGRTRRGRRPLGFAPMASIEEEL